MSKITEAQQILEALGLPKAKQNERSSLILLALCKIKETDKWENAQKVSMSVVGNKDNPKYEGVMRFIAEHYNKQYAENSRETFRRQTLHQFVQAGIVEHNPENPQLPTNSKDNHYRLTDASLKVIQAFGSKKWNNEVKIFLKNVGSLKEKYNKSRNLHKIALTLANGEVLTFSPGKHNEVQVAIIEEFAPRFAQGCELLYVGDTAKKGLFVDSKTLTCEESLKTLTRK